MFSQGQITEASNAIQALGVSNFILVVLILIVLAMVIGGALLAWRFVGPFLRLLAESSKERQEIQRQNLLIQNEMLKASSEESILRREAIEIQRNTMMAINENRIEITRAAQEINRQQDEGRNAAAQAITEEVVKSRNSASADAETLRDEVRSVSSKVDEVLKLVSASTLAEIVSEQLVQVHDDLRRIESKIPEKVVNEDSNRSPDNPS